jgi:hypothetical protein
MKPKSAFPFFPLLILTICFTHFFLLAATTAQLPEPPISTASPNDVSSKASVWEFGMQVSSVGNARGISGVLPIPMDWPEQEVVVDFEKKTDNVGKLKYSNPTKTSRQLEFKIKRLSGGESAEALVRFRINKRMIEAPGDTRQLTVPTPLPDHLKTYLQPSPYIECDDPNIRKIAQELTDDTLSAWEQVEKNYRWVRENISYKFDVQIHSCLDALERKQGDCEELTSMFIALCRAQDIPARAVWIPGHAYPEFYLEDEQGTGRWFPCQAAGPYEFGSMTEARPILQKGDRVRLPGTRKIARYLQPTLQARDAARQIRIQWISREVTKVDNSPRGSK